MPWSRTWLQSLGTPVNIRLQVLAHHMQQFLDRVWEGNPQTFLKQVLQEHEQLRRHLDHRRHDTAQLTAAMQVVSKLAHEYVAEMMKRPTEITEAQFASLYAYTMALQRVGKGVEDIANDLQLDLQMSEDVDTIARIVRECARKRAIEEEVLQQSTQEEETETPKGWRAREGHYHLEENWYGTERARAALPLQADSTSCTCTRQCTAACGNRLEGIECPLTESDC